MNLCFHQRAENSTNINNKFVKILFSIPLSLQTLIIYYQRHQKVCKISLMPIIIINWDSIFLYTLTKVNIKHIKINPFCSSKEKSKLLSSSKKVFAWWRSTWTPTLPRLARRAALATRPWRSRWVSGLPSARQSTRPLLRCRCWRSVAANRRVNGT